MAEPSSASTERGAEQPPFPVGPEVMPVLGALWSTGHGAYLVGGGVRDALLGLPVSDWDIATDARPERLLRVFPGSSYQNRFGTVLARGLEITTFRRDHRYADHRRPDAVTFSSDIFEDLARRDLTINAIAWGRRSADTVARTVDPADGRGDLAAGLVRAVGDPSRRFDEDALRLLRAVRIAAKLDFTIEPVTRAAMVEHAADVAWVSEERVGAELRRMLAEPTPSRAFLLLAETDLLVGVLPELAVSSEDRLQLSLRTLDETAEVEPRDERLLLAGLLSELEPADVRTALERLRVGSRDVDAVVALVPAAVVPYDRAWSDADVRRYMGQVPAELLDPLLRLRLARARAATAERPAAVADEAELQERIAAQRARGAALTLADLAIDGQDLRDTLGVPEGPIIGAILDRLLADVIEDPALNARLTLLTRASLVLDETVRGGTAGNDPARSPIR